jgi:hypothetical protein
MTTASLIDHLTWTSVRHSRGWTAREPRGFLRVWWSADTPAGQACRAVHDQRDQVERIAA